MVHSTWYPRKSNEIFVRILKTCTDLNGTDPIEVSGNKLLSWGQHFHLSSRHYFLSCDLPAKQTEILYAYSPPTNLAPQLWPRSWPICLCWVSDVSRALLLAEFCPVPCDTKPGVGLGAAHNDWSHPWSSHTVPEGPVVSNLYQALPYCMYHLPSTSWHEALHFPWLWYHPHILSSSWN